MTAPEDAGHHAVKDLRVATITIPWTGPMPAAVKGIVHVPAHNTPIKPSRRETLLTAIAKARQWVDDVAQGRIATFAQIARREGKVERHVRLLAPLAFLSPRIVGGDHRRDRAGRSHRHFARSRVTLFLGRAGAAAYGIQPCKKTRDQSTSSLDRACMCRLKT